MMQTVDLVEHVQDMKYGKLQLEGQVERRSIGCRSDQLGFDAADIDSSVQIIPLREKLSSTASGEGIWRREI